MNSKTFIKINVNTIKRKLKVYNLLNHLTSNVYKSINEVLTNYSNYTLTKIHRNDNRELKLFICLVHTIK